MESGAAARTSGRVGRVAMLDPRCRHDGSDAKRWPCVCGHVYAANRYEKRKLAATVCAEMSVHPLHAPWISTRGANYSAVSAEFRMFELEGRLVVLIPRRRLMELFFREGVSHDATAARP